jgi:arylsulfatase A
VKLTLMIREIFGLTAYLFAGVFLLLSGCTPSVEKPVPGALKANIILIVVDDMGFGDLGIYGSQLHQTPHMDQLAESGMRFTDFHTNGPVCSPTRAALMTGQYQQRSGIESAIGFVKDEGVPLSKITIAELLSEIGYTCGVVGKWHLGHVDNFGPNDQGFDLSYCSNNSPDYHSHVSRNGQVDWYKNHKLHKEPGYLTEVVTAHSREFIEANKEQPFFLFASHPAVHFPFQGPGDPPFRTTGKLWHGNERIPGKVQPDSKYGPLPPEEYKRAYRDMLQAVDASVGAIVTTLEELNLLERTLIVVTSDNGAYSWVGSNGPYRGQKGDLFEGGHRVPAIFSWPGKIPGGKISDDTTMTMDLAPTFLSVAGVKQPDNVSFDGIDLRAVLFEQESLPSRTFFWRFNNSYTTSHTRAVREGDWKYVVDEGETYLFDLNEDPGEQRNLAGSKPNLVKEMAQSFLAWEQDVTCDETAK